MEYPVANVWFTSRAHNRKDSGSRADDLLRKCRFFASPTSEGHLLANFSFFTSTPQLR